MDFSRIWRDANSTIVQNKCVLCNSLIIFWVLTEDFYTALTIFLLSLTKVNSNPMQGINNWKRACLKKLGRHGSSIFEWNLEKSRRIFTYFWRILFQSKKTLNTAYFKNYLPYFSTLQYGHYTTTIRSRYGLYTATKPATNQLLTT